jgi:CMP-N-acetylneuraminic acid synthetase
MGNGSYATPSGSNNLLPGNQVSNTNPQIAEGRVRKIICTICARGGSKGVKNKNFRDLHGKPLIAHTIEQAQAAGFSDNLAVSSDSPQILEVARNYDVPYIVRRPDQLASDTADKLDAIRHAVSSVEEETRSRFDDILDLDPTSPLRVPADITAALRLFYEKNAENLITAAPSRRSPYFNMVEQNEQGFAHLSKAPPARVLRRQDSPRCYDMNASIYIWARDFLFQEKRVFGEKTALYVMPEERSIDIDSELDFEFVSFLMMKNARAAREVPPQDR